ncbi:MAG: hypothetical protein V4498_00650 [candidate division FCPU426 bacterium]
MRPGIIRPGLTLVHHVAQQGFLDALVGNLEAWGQWGSGGDLQACHVEGFYDVGQIAKMNPKVSCLYPMEQAPWATIQPLRLDLSRYGALGVPQYPDMDPAWVANFKVGVLEHLGESYAWGQIFRFSWIGLLARVWPTKAQKLLKARNPDALADGHAHVCSQWWTDRLETAVRQTYGHLGPDLAQYDLFKDTNVGDGAERPADYIKSLDLRPVQN